MSLIKTTAILWLILAHGTLQYWHYLLNSSQYKIDPSHIVCKKNMLQNDIWFSLQSPNIAYPVNRSDWHRIWQVCTARYLDLHLDTRKYSNNASFSRLWCWCIKESSIDKKKSKPILIMLEIEAISVPLGFGRGPKNRYTGNNSNGRCPLLPILTPSPCRFLKLWLLTLLFTSTNPHSPRSEDLDPLDIMESALIGGWSPHWSLFCWLSKPCVGHFWWRQRLCRKSPNK